MKRVLLLSVAALLAGLLLWWAPWRGRGGVGPSEDAGAPAAPDAGAPPSAVAPLLRGDPRAGHVPEARQPSTLHGRVLDAATRRPVGGAAVSAFGFEDLRRLETRTREDGGFELPDTAGRAGAFHLVVTAPPYGRFADDSARPRAEPWTILLEPEGSIAGRLVEGADGSAVRRFRVLALRRFETFRDRQSAFNAMPEEQAVQGSVAVDDPQGRFRIGGLPTGTYALVFLVEDRHPFFWSGGAASYDPDGFAVLAGAATDAGEVPLPSSQRVVVRVLDAVTDRPLAGATFEGSLLVDDREIRIPLRPLEVRAGSDYVLSLPFDARGQLMDADVLVRVAGYAPEHTGGAGQAPGLVFEVRLTAPATLKGTVRVDAGDGAGLLVLVRRSVDRRVVATAVAGPGGAFSIADLAAGVDLEVLVFERAADRLRLNVPLRLRPGETRVLALGAPDATGVAGRVAVGGKPVAQAWVFLDAGDQRIHCPTDEEGRFRFEGVPPGRCPLFVNLDVLGAGAASLQRTVTVSDGRMTRIDVDLSIEVHGRLTTRRLDGSASDAKEKTVVARAAATSSEPTDWTPETRTAPDGSFTLRLPGPGPWLIDLDEEDLYLDAGAVPVDLSRARGAAEPVNLVATVDPQDGRIEIVVRDAETGEVVPDAEYQYSWRHTSGAGSSEGAAPVVVENAGLGTYRFALSATTQVGTSVEIEVTARQRNVKTAVSLPRSDAVRLRAIEPASQAEAAGLRVGDVVLRYADTRVRNLQDLAAALKATSPTDLIRLEILRAGAAQTVTVHGGRLGVELENTRASP